MDASFTTPKISKKFCLSELAMI